MSNARGMTGGGGMLKLRFDRYIRSSSLTGRSFPVVVSQLCSRVSFYILGKAKEEMSAEKG